jgi:hypothetical protein
MKEMFNKAAGLTDPRNESFPLYLIAVMLYEILSELQAKEETCPCLTCGRRPA